MDESRISEISNADAHASADERLNRSEKMNDTPKLENAAYGGSPGMTCSAICVKDWTATDATQAVMMVDDVGTAWQVARVEWDGTVHVVSQKTIRLDERHHWRAYLFPQNAGLSHGEGGKKS